MGGAQAHPERGDAPLARGVGAHGDPAAQTADAHAPTIAIILNVDLAHCRGTRYWAKSKDI